jgi:hypothetical protein
MSFNNIFGQVKTSTAIITDINKKGIYLRPDPSCEKQLACHGCTICSDPPQSGPKLFYPASGSKTFKLNQIITITHFVPNEVLAAIIVFGIPIICSIATFIILHLVNPATTDSIHAISLIVLAFIFGFIIVFLLDKIIRIMYPITILDKREFN